MVIYNANAIAGAASVQPSPFLIGLIALSNGLGRVAAGWLSDHIKNMQSVAVVGSGGCADECGARVTVVWMVRCVVCSVSLCDFSIRLHGQSGRSECD